MDLRAREGWRNAATVALLAVATGAFGSTPMAPDEVRAERRIREDRPLWRSALALPDTLVQVLLWPLEQSFYWAERVDLPDRIEHVIGAPFRSEPSIEERR